MDIDEEPPPASGLSDREYELVSRIHSVAIWMARSKPGEVKRRIMDDFNCTEAVADQWMRKAEDFMHLGVMEGVADARAVYRDQLMRIYLLAMSMTVRNQVEITQKPVKVRVESTDGVQQDPQVITATITKTKANVLDVGAMSVALKAAKEMAYIAGARPSGKAGNMQINQQFNIGQDTLPDANLLQDLSNDQLVKLLGSDLELVGTDLPHHIIDSTAVDVVAGNGVDQGDHPSNG